MGASASRFDSGEFCELRRDRIRLIDGDGHFKQREKGNITEVCRTATAVDQNGDAGGCGTAVADDGEAFIDATAAGDDVLDNKDAFAGSDFEVAAQFEAAVDLFGENVALVGLPRHLLADHQASHCRGQNRVKREIADLLQQQFGEAGDEVHVLADLGALEKLWAVKTRAQDEVPVEEGSGLAKNVDDFVMGVGHVSKMADPRKN